MEKNHYNNNSVNKDKYNDNLLFITLIEKGAIESLVGLLKEKKPKGKENQKNKNDKDTSHVKAARAKEPKNRINRPIICICNDLYVPGKLLHVLSLPFDCYIYIILYIILYY